MGQKKFKLSSRIKRENGSLIIKKSSIWQGIKWVQEDVNEGTRWLVGNGANLSVWNDNWIRSTTLGVQHPNNAYMNRFPEMKVAYLILD